MTVIWGQDQSGQPGKFIALDTEAVKTMDLNQLPKF